MPPGNEQEEFDNLSEEEQAKLKEEEPKEKEDEKEVTTPREESNSEKIARAGGWVPQEEWVAQGNDPEDWRDAKTFNDRGELFDKIASLKQQIKNSNKSLKTLSEHHKKVYEKAHQEALEELKSQFEKAVEDGDAKKITDINEKMLDLKLEKPDVPDVDVDDTSDEDANMLHTKFLQKNPWYDTDTDLRAEADSYSWAYRSRNPNASPQDVYDHVEKLVKKANPGKFTTKDVDVAPVASGSNKSATSKESSSNTDTPLPKLTELPFEIQKIAKELVASGAFKNEEEYIKELRELGEV